MKKLIVVVIAIFFAQISFAQNTKKDRFTPEQRAEIQVKKLTLVLDLNNAQAEQIKELQLKQMKEKKLKKNARKTNNSKLSSDEKYQKIIASLDKRIAIKKRYKEILTPDQYKKWEHLFAKRAKHKRKAKTKKRS